MDCHQCGTCCTEISISSAIPGMSTGKAAGVRCINLKGTLCGIFGHKDRPAVCSSFAADIEICGSNKEEATKLIRWYERATAP